MPSKKQPTVWDAPPHTIAKIAILEGYLKAWFPIMGRSVAGRDLLYLDGFAGPGHYTNYSTGSPIAALRAASKAISGGGASWKARTVHCVFIEVDRERLVHLREHLGPFESHQGIKIHLHNTSFVDGLERVRLELPHSLTGPAPLFAFIDPFGAKGVPFACVAEILHGRTSEVLLNFDADAVVRIFLAGGSASSEQILTDIYGDTSWKTVLAQANSFRDQYQLALDLYKSRLRMVGGAKYVFSFAMGKTGSAIDYHLVFATKHPLGQEKMKEAMRKLDQAGDYRFSDSYANTAALIRWDRPEDFAPKMFQEFAGQTVAYTVLRDYALNESPFVNPKGMLKILEQQGYIDVVSANPRRRVGTYPDGTISLVSFREVASDGKEEQYRVD